MPSLLGTKLLSLAMLLFSSSIQESEAKENCSIQLLNAESVDIDGNVEKSKVHWQWVCKDSNQTASAVEAAKHELTDEEQVMRSNRSSVRIRRGKSSTPNGCSIPGNLPFLYKRTFTPACNEHDRCYHNKKYSRLGCDNRFLGEMLKICRDRAKTLIGILTLKICAKTALVYYGAVRLFGSSYYG